MNYFTAREAKAYAQKVKLPPPLVQLHTAVASFSQFTRRYDIFLSHSHYDKSDIKNLYITFSEFGFTPYVDWINDNFSANEIDTGNPNIAERLKNRISNSKCLLYATSSHSEESQWMPWELGYSDSTINKVAIFPYLDTNQAFKKYGFLNLYPVVEFNNRKENFYINGTQLVDWINS